MAVVAAQVELYGREAFGHLTWYRAEPRSLAGMRVLASWLAPLTALFKRS